MNDCIEEGLYITHFSEAIRLTANRPSEVTVYPTVTSVIKIDENYIVQTLYSWQGSVFRRFKTIGNWGSWEKYNTTTV